MSVPAPANLGVSSPPPVSSPVSSPEEDRGSSKTASPRGHHIAPYAAMAPVGSSSYPPPPSLPSTTSKAPPSVSGSRTTATSPPTTVSNGLGGPALPHGPHGAVPPPGGASIATMSLNPDLPSRDSQLHIAEARAALIASMSNMLDSELQSRASVLHANATVLSRQEQDVARATEALRKENDKLAKVAKDAGRKIKELGNVQNWAEVLERDFLVLEETMRLVRDGGAESDDDGSSGSDYSGSSWSGSESEQEGEGGGIRLRSAAGSRKHSASELRERNRDGGGEKGTTAKMEKGKALVDSGGSTAGGGSTPSIAFPASSAPNLPRSSNATVSLDAAVLESLTEALATDLRVGLTSAKQNAT
ncbi:hypothetical protein F5Y12DRAFT_292654 [Xylaria sp. FL1777]|nr:hypothetical protein F5Y12DRAFT_292654 [Xylaria sp. FL1777]